MDLYNAKLTDVHKTEGKVSFAVAMLPHTPYWEEEEPHVLYDWYFLRTGESIEKAKNNIGDFLIKEGFSRQRFNGNYLLGDILFKDKEILVKPIPETINGFNFWIAEGLIGDYFDKHNKEIPKIRTLRTATKKLFKDGCNVNNMEESSHSILNLITDVEKRSVINIAPLYLKQYPWQLAQNKRGKGKLSIFNSGKIGESYMTVFRNPDTKNLYHILNKEIYSKQERDVFSKNSLKLPKLNTITKAESITFEGSCEVSERFFFDGSLNDVFEILKDSRKIKFEKGILD